MGLDTGDKVGKYSVLPLMGGVAGVIAASAVGATPVGMGLAGAAGLLGVLNNILSADAAAEQSDAAIKTEKYRKKIAQENAELAFSESLEQASKARREHIYLSSKMALSMSARGIAPAIQELWLGQTLAEMEHERQTILGSGQKKAMRYHKEADWLQGNIGSLQRSQKLTNWAYAANAIASIFGAVGQQYQWNRQKNTNRSEGVS